MKLLAVETRFDQCDFGTEIETLNHTVHLCVYTDVVYFYHSVSLDSSVGHGRKTFSLKQMLFGSA